MKILRIALMFFAQSLGTQQATTPGSLQGVVVIAGTEDPVSGGVVELQRVDAQSDPFLVSTQPNGRFSFQNIPPGRYRLIATRTGYLSAEWGQRSSAGRGAPFALTPGQQLSGLRLALTPTGAVSGRILDRAGQPMAGVAVQLLTPVFQDGRRTMSVVKSVLTNDLGDYRVFWLPPGSYYVNVVPSVSPGSGGGTLVMNPTGQPGGRSLWANQYNIALRPVGYGLLETEAYLPVYYPGTSDDSAASVVDLRPGAEVRGIDIRVVPVRAWRVRGVAMNGTTGKPLAGAGVQLISQKPGSGLTMQATADAMGVFVIPRVPQGPYLLLLQGSGLGRQIAIEMRDADLDLSIDVLPMFTLSGRVVVERSDGRSAPDPSAFGVRLRLNYPSNPPQLNINAGSDGSFTFRTVPAADYRVFVQPIFLPQSPPPPSVPSNLRNTYVKSIRMGDADLLESSLQIEGQPERQLEILIGTNPGTVTGRVLNSRQEPSIANTVVLLPDLPRRLHRTDLYKTTSTDESGRFLLEALPPGDYRLFAWEDVADRAWQDPAFMKGYEDMGHPVRIAEGGRITVELVAISGSR